MLAAKPKVYLSRLIPEPGMRILQEQTDLYVNPNDASASREDILDAMHGADGIVGMLSDDFGTEILAEAASLKVISLYAVGYNNVDLETAKKKGIAVTNTPGVLTDATADIAFALMITAARRIAEADAWLRNNDFAGWAPMLFLGRDLRNKTLGIIGAGRIGRALAQRAALGFGMNILCHSRTPVPEWEQLYGARFVGKEELLRESDFVSLNVPLTSETRHFIAVNELAMMKRSAILVNTSRGPVVDEAALIEALKKRTIYAAGLDVYEDEPRVPDALRQLSNAVILPHIGSASIETREKMAVLAAENCLAVLQGKEPKHRVA